MLRNYFKIAFRNLMRYKFISFINLFGLTIGLACCLLILAYILNELSFDKSNVNASRIYRVTRSFNTPDGVENLHLGAVAPPFGPLLQNDFPDIQKMTRILGTGTSAFRYKEKLFNEKNVYFADENFFSFFSATVVKGSPQTGLTEPRSIMLSEEIARKYFGEEDPIDQLMRVDNQLSVKVTGVFKALPSNSQFHPEILFSFNTLKDSAVYGEKQLMTNWGNNSFFTYLLFPEHYPVENIARQFPAFLDKHMGPKSSATTKLYFQKFTDIHLRSHLDDELEANGDIKRVYIFSAIALFILLIACINYMNLSTARSVLRAREIGVRKVIGAQRMEIIWQFLSESVLITWIALLLALVLAWFILPYLNKLSGQDLSISSLFRPQIIVPVLLLPFAVGLLSGIYPALFMSSFKPIMVLKGIFKAGNSNISFRKVLVVTQFGISIVLIIATTVVFQQLKYMQNASLGYSKENVVTMGYVGSLSNQYESFRNELLRDPNVKEAGRSSRIPTGRLLDDQGIAVLAGDSMMPVNVDVKYVNADYHFIPTYGITMAAGRNFSKDFGTDSNSYVINESAVSILGWKEPRNAIGKDLAYGGVRGKVIGVMRDFHFESMHQKIVPLLLSMGSVNNGNYNVLSVKIGNNNVSSSLAHIENTWKKYLPETPYQSIFLDDRYNRLYQSEQQQGSIFTIFACIAIFIACLGLFGLSAFTITQRIKEIGIRKVLGADTGSIVTLLSKDFLKLIMIAAFISFPVAWYAMHSWLQDFAYRTSMHWWVFVMAGLIAALVAFVTISFQAIKAALANPVKSLRTE